MVITDVYRWEPAAQFSTYPLLAVRRRKDRGKFSDIENNKAGATLGAIRPHSTAGKTYVMDSESQIAVSLRVGPVNLLSLLFSISEDFPSVFPRSRGSKEGSVRENCAAGFPQESKDKQ